MISTAGLWTPQTMIPQQGGGGGRLRCPRDTHQENSHGTAVVMGADCDLREEGTQHLTPAMSERRRRRRKNPGSTKTSSSRDQAAPRAPAAPPSLLPVLPLTRKSSESPSRHTDSSACLPTGPLRKNLNLGPMFGIASPKQHSFRTSRQKSQTHN